MAPPYSLDLRWRVLWLKVVEGMSPDAIASLMNISERTVRRYVAKFYQTGDIQPKEHKNGPQQLLGEFEQIILVRLLSENPSIYLYEVKQELERMFGVSVSVSTIFKTLRLIGFTRKAMHHVALQQSEQLRAEFMATISVYDPAMIIWVDESGCDRRNSARKYGYSLRGLPVCDHRLLCRGKRYSAIPLVSINGILDVYLAEGNVDGEKFEQFVEESLLPVLMPFNAVNPRSIVVMDNASVHHVQPVIDLIENQAQAKLIFLPPYSPDLNPAEEVFSKVKYVMKEYDRLFQTCTNPRVLLLEAFSLVTPENCTAYIHNSGYI
jgi:transposase